MQDKPRSVILEKIIVITLLVTIDISELILTSHTLPNLLVVPRLTDREILKNLLRNYLSKKLLEYFIISVDCMLLPFFFK